MRKLRLGRNQGIQGKFSGKCDSDLLKLTIYSNLTWEFLRTGESKVMARVVWRVRLLPVLTLQRLDPGGGAGVLQERPDSSGKGFQQNNKKNPDNGRRKWWKTAKKFNQYSYASKAKENSALSSVPRNADMSSQVIGKRERGWGKKIKHNQSLSNSASFGHYLSALVRKGFVATKSHCFLDSCRKMYRTLR